MTRSQVRHALGLNEELSDDEFRRAIFDEVAEDLRLSPVGMLKMPVHLISRLIARKTDDEPAEDWFVRGKLAAWADSF